MVPSDDQPPSPFETELLLALAEEQERFERGEWSFTGTFWSRVSYRMAKAREETRPSPVPGKFDISDSFRSRFGRAVNRLISRGFVQRRQVWGMERRRRFTLGYRLHQQRGRDIILTEAGRAWVRERTAAQEPATDPRRVEYHIQPRDAESTQDSWGYEVRIAPSDEE